MTDNQTPQLLTSVVVHGQQLGRKLGFPTANLDVAKLLGALPSSGVYAAYATLEDGSVYDAMVNVGHRPTVENSGHQLSVEAHLAEFDGDLYGQQLHLCILKRIRDERKMNSLEELKAQLKKDLESVRLICNVQRERR